MDRLGRVPVIAGGFVVGSVGCVLTALGCVADSAPLVILGFIGVGAMNGGVLLARTAAADMYPESRKRERSPTSSSARCSALRSGRSFSVRSSPGRTSSSTRSSSPGSSPPRWRRRAHHRARHPPRSADDRARARARGPGARRAPTPEPAAPLGADPAPTRRPVRGHRRDRELRGDGQRDEPDRLHRRRPRPRAGRRLHRHQPAHRRDVRARARRRSARRSRRPPSLAHRRARGHGRLDGDARVGRRRSRRCRSRSSCSASAGTSRTSRRPRSS